MLVAPPDGSTKTLHHPDKNRNRIRRLLLNIPLVTSIDRTLVPTVRFQPPTLYVFNAASLAKPNAIEQLTVDLSGYAIDIAVISETHLKSKHADNLFNIAGFSCSDATDRRGHADEWQCMSGRTSRRLN